jgi:hypothetical protein
LSFFFQGFLFVSPVLPRSQKGPAAHALRDNITEPANLEDALAKLHTAMEHKGSDIQERLRLAKQEQKKDAYVKIVDKVDLLSSIKQSVDQFYKSFEQDDVLGVTIHIKSAMSKVIPVSHYNMVQFLLAPGIRMRLCIEHTRMLLYSLYHSKYSYLVIGRGPAYS